MQLPFTPRVIGFIFITVFFGAIASGSQILSIDSNPSHHLTIGNYILDNRIIPIRDLFTWAGDRSTNYYVFSISSFMLIIYHIQPMFETG